MINHLRTLSARLITRWLRRPRALVVRAWFWLTGHADRLDEKRWCLKTVLWLDPNCEVARTALERLLLQPQTATHLHPANAEAIAEFSDETGAEVLRGTPSYPSDSGGWQLGEIDFSEHPAKYRGHDVVIVIASVGEVGEVEKEKLA